MAGVVGVHHGEKLINVRTLTSDGTTTLNGPLTGTYITTGQFTVTAAGTTTITDSGIQLGSLVQFSAANSAAGLLLATKSCFVGTVSAGSFTWLCSATAAGAPAGTEVINYFAISES